jgi:hypothetical protein
MKNVSQVLRAAMVEAEKRGVSLYRIAKACKLDDSIVYRFYHSECGLALTSVDRLCQYLGLELNESGTAPWAARNPLSGVKKKAAQKSAVAESKSKPASTKRSKKKPNGKIAAVKPMKKTAKKKKRAK